MTDRKPTDTTFVVACLLGAVTGWYLSIYHVVPWLAGCDSECSERCEHLWPVDRMMAKFRGAQ